MLLIHYLPKHVLSKRQHQQGFVVLVTTVLLSIAGIAFTAHMVSSQLMDNKVIANYYRSNEAFANAESGFSFALSQFDDPEIAQSLIANLPAQFDKQTHHYSVTIERINDSQVLIISNGTSNDGTANRTVSAEADYYLNFPIPKAALSSNGRLSLDDSALVNDGCEGLSSDECTANGNIAEYMLLSNPNVNTQGADFCSAQEVGEAVALEGSSDIKLITAIVDESGIERLDWGDNNFVAGSEIAGVEVDASLEVSSLFEATFSLEMSDNNLDQLWGNTVSLDMSNGGDCAARLTALDDQDDVVFIKGDCDISQYYADPSNSIDANVFTIGSASSPKLVFIEGGTFITDTNTVLSVVGMLYFLPGTQDLMDNNGNLVDLSGEPLIEEESALQIPEVNLDLGHVHSNGALLSEYQCAYVQGNNITAQPHFSARFDKSILDTLYAKLGVKAISSGARVSAGTWSDF